MNQVILTPRNYSVTGEKAKQLKGSMVDKEGVRIPASFACHKTCSHSEFD